ncbi:MAG: transcriptional regulator [Gammaproteobacteria bacterium]|nr:transcriptional regulator [Gammaproteobacteria bacterium]
MASNTIKPIRTETDYESSLVRIEELMEAVPGTDEFDELDVLTDLVEHYESKHYPIGHPSPVAAIKFRMDQGNLSPRDLIPFIGSRAKVSEVLSGKRSLTMPMARALHEHLGIPAEVLLQKADVAFDDTHVNLEWSKFPLKAMVKRGWIPDMSNLSDHAEEIIRDLINRAGGVDVAISALYRKNDHVRANAKMDPYALRAWCWQVLSEANENQPEASYERGTVTLDFLKAVARLSRFETGPKQAKELLEEHGIAFVIAQHLAKTYLDGAALRLGDGRPVIGLTLRYDRIDNFWFCLLHELAHVGCHLDNDKGSAFVDDMSLRKAEGEREDPREKEADDWAAEALISQEAWNSSDVKDHPTSMAVMNLASELEIHPAIVAGQVRYKQQNYRLLSQFVGTGEIRRSFGIAS